MTLASRSNETARYLGLKFVSRSWFNLDATWAVSLILVGGLALVISLAD